MNTCTICRDENRTEIDRALVRGEASRPIASQFGVGYKSVQRHKECIAGLIADARERLVVSAIDLSAELADCLTHAKKVREACHRWLTDPEDPTRYTLDTRANELVVIYDEWETSEEGAKPQRKRETLENLLLRLERGLAGVMVQKVESKQADPRELILKSLQSLDRHLRMFGDKTGAFQKPGENEKDRERLTVEVVALYNKLRALAEHSFNCEACGAANKPVSIAPDEIKAEIVGYYGQKPEHKIIVQQALERVN